MTEFSIKNYVRSTWPGVGAYPLKAVKVVGGFVGYVAVLPVLRRFAPVQLLNDLS
jgi:hypothetical protein